MQISINSNDLDDPEDFSMLHDALSLALATLRQAIPTLEWDGEVEE